MSSNEKERRTSIVDDSYISVVVVTLRRHVLRSRRAPLDDPPRSRLNRIIIHNHTPPFSYKWRGI